MEKYDLVIIGGGAGAFAAAIGANDLKKKTVVINAGLPLGGTCVNVGCLPSKILLHAGEVLYMTKNHKINGIELELKNFDFKKVVEDEIQMVKDSRDDKYTKVLDSLEHVSLIEGMAKFVSKNEVEVNKKTIQGDKFIIATGSKANVPDIKNIEEVGYLTHIEALELKKQPKEMAIVGSGPVGLEFAQMYSRFGTKITILQRGDNVFSSGEEELINKLVEILKSEGIDIKTGVSVKSARKEGDKKILSYEVDGKEEEISVDQILLASGKTANTKNLGLDLVGVETVKNHSIKVDENFKTSNENIFAIGDAAYLPVRLETTAGHEGTLVAKNALDGKKESINYNEVPSVIFTDPQYASVGQTEEMQFKETGTCACRTVSFDKIPKAQIIRREEGMIKMGIDPKTKVIVGVHILAPNAGDLISQAMVLIKNKNTIDDVLNMTPVFPTLAESIKYVSLSFTKDLSKLSCCI